MEILKNIKKNTIIIILVTILVMYFVLKKDFLLIIKNLQNLDIKYLLIALVCFFIYIILHSYAIYKTVNKKEKFSLKESIKHTMIVQFFNGITPFSTGGQPMEIYMLSKHGISISRASNYILQNFVFYQIALAILGIIAILLNYKFHMFEQNAVLRQIVLLGFIINTLVAAVLLFISLSKKTIFKVIKYILKILYKINLIKDIDQENEKWIRRMNEFHECADELKKKKSLFFLGIVLNFIGLIAWYSIPLFLAYSLGDFISLNLMKSLTASAYVMVAGSFIPIPGASGGIEYAFTKFFSNFLEKNKVATILILWRFITYYLGMILGAILFNFDKEKTN